MPPEGRDIPGFEQTLAHAKAGYANSQEVIRFMDTKAAAFIGLASVTMAAPVLTFQWLAGQAATSVFCLQSIRCYSHWPSTIAAICAGLGLVCGLLSLCRAVSVLRARSPLAKTPVTTLFPMFNAKKELRRAHRVLSALRTGLTQREILREYELQIRCVGSILYAKGDRLREATMFFTCQIIAYFFATVFLLAGIGLSLFCAGIHA